MISTVNLALLPTLFLLCNFSSTQKYSSILAVSQRSHPAVCYHALHPSFPHFLRAIAQPRRPSLGRPALTAPWGAALTTWHIRLPAAGGAAPRGHRCLADGARRCGARRLLGKSRVRLAGSSDPAHDRKITYTVWMIHSESKGAVWPPYVIVLPIRFHLCKAEFSSSGRSFLCSLGNQILSPQNFPVPMPPAWTNFPFLVIDKSLLKILLSP